MAEAGLRGVDPTNVVLITRAQECIRNMEWIKNITPETFLGDNEDEA